MPKVSKVRPVSTRPGDAPPPKEVLDKFLCTRCGKIFKQQRYNFPASRSPLYIKNGGYLPICSNCAEELLAHYKHALGDEASAMRRMCMKFDMYWNPDIYAMVSKANTSNSRFKGYISKMYLVKYAGKTFDDTLDEEGLAGTPVIRVVDDCEDNNAADDIPTVSAATVAFWGTGFSPEIYAELDARYDRWTRNLPMPIDNAAETLYRQICILEVTISRNAAAGKPIETTVNALNNLLGSANLKPVQKKQEENLDTDFENMPFGVGIRMCENSRPIPKPNPELEDVDGIIRYITIWFLGHLCKMLGIRNTYCKLYEDEMARLKVERLENDEDDDEGAFNDIFGDGGGDAS